MTVKKGMRVRATWWATEVVALAGAAMKVQGTPVEVVGTVRHVRGDDPFFPTTVGVFLEIEDDDFKGETVRPPRCTCPHPHVLVKPEWITEVV